MEEAAKMVMSCEPLKATPLMFLVVWRIVAVPALPETEPVMVLSKVLLPVKWLVSPKSVEEAVLSVLVTQEKEPLDHLKA